MKKFLEKQKGSNGITLIALVITIIVLLILAAISIATLTRENGILGKATEAKEKSERTEIIENARIDILAKQSDKEGKITKEELANILEPKYGTLSNEEEILDKILTTKDGKYKIKVEEIWNGKFTESKITCYHFYVNDNLVSWSNVNPDSIADSVISMFNDDYGSSDQGWELEYRGSAEGYFICSPDSSIEMCIGYSNDKMPENGKKFE